MTSKKIIEDAIKDFGSSEHRRGFLRYHKENPEVMVKFIEKAIQIKMAGRDRYGAKAIAELIRFHFHVNVKSEGFKFNNAHTAYYARAVMALKPELKNFFELRESPNKGEK